MSFHSTLVEHYAAVRVRLRAPSVDLDFMPEIESRPALLLDYRPLPHLVDDPIPDQRGASMIMKIGVEAELIAARRALAGFARRQPGNTAHSVRQLQAAVAEAFKVDLHEILGPSRRAGHVRVRHIAMTLAIRVCRHSIAEIGRRFNRDHTTVMHAEKKFAWLLDGATSQIGGTGD